MGEEDSISPQEQQAVSSGCETWSRKTAAAPQDSSGSEPCLWSGPSSSGKNYCRRGGGGCRDHAGLGGMTMTWASGELGWGPTWTEGGGPVYSRPWRPCVGSGALGMGWDSLLLQGQGGHGDKTQEAPGENSWETLACADCSNPLLIVPKTTGLADGAVAAGEGGKGKLRFIGEGARNCPLFSWGVVCEPWGLTFMPSDPGPIRVPLVSQCSALRVTSG